MTETTTEIWKEPVRGSFADVSVLGLHGLERMRAAVRRRLPAPPIHHLSGLFPVEASTGTSVFGLPASPWFQNAAGVFPPGLMAWAADAPLGSAVLTALPPGRVMTTSDLTLNFLRPATVASERLLARARLIHAGESLALAEGTIEDAHGRLLGHATTRGFLFDPISPAPAPPEELPPIEVDDHPTADPYLRVPVVGEVIPQEVWDRSTGLEITTGIMAGELPPPPIYHLLGIHPTAADEGAATFVMPASGWLASPGTTVYGGAIAFLAEFALSVAVQHTVPPGTATSPLDLKVNFLRPVFPDGRMLTATARVIHRGRTLAVSNATLTNEDGKTVAVGTSSAIILPDRPWATTTPITPVDEAPTDGDDA